jgi:acetate kinase
MPPYAFHYAIPHEFYEKHHVRRYGFHGTSHKFVGRRAAEMLGKPFSKFTGITCHLGNGCSMAAIRNGQSVDTSMGLTPLEGQIMGTRSGDIDPALGFFLTREAGIGFEELDSLLNRKSGMLGVSGLSNDVRTLVEAAARGHKRATLALDMFAYRVRKYIGAYMAVLNGCDAIVFTGGVGENAAPLRERICSNLEYLGVSLDVSRNAGVFSREAIISSPLSKVALLVVPTNEELEIARDTAWISRAIQSGKHWVQVSEETL